MITKEKAIRFTSSDGGKFESVEDAKRQELMLLVGFNKDMTVISAFEQLTLKPREAIAILRVGLPRKPRTVKAKAVKARKSKAQPHDDPPRVRTATEIKAANS